MQTDAPISSPCPHRRCEKTQEDVVSNVLKTADEEDEEAALSVHTRFGSIPGGRIRDHVLDNGAWRDSLLYSPGN
jgi:hypothetical protein